MTTTVRLADTGDLDGATSLAMTLGGNRTSDREVWRAALNDDIQRPDRCLFVAFLDGRLVGEGRVRHFDLPADAPPNTATAGYYLIGVGVLPQARRRGLGKQLTVARMEWTAAHSDIIWFFTEATNQASLELHARLGFREITRDFAYPGVRFPKNGAVLSAAKLSAIRL